MLVSSLVHERIALWRENAVWELVLFSKLQYTLGDNSVVCHLKILHNWNQLKVMTKQRVKEINKSKKRYR